MTDKLHYFKYILLALIFSLTACEYETPAYKPTMNFYEQIQLFKVEPEINWSSITGRIQLIEKTKYNDSLKKDISKSEVFGFLYTDEQNYVDGGGLKIYDKWVKLKNLEEVLGYIDPISDRFSIGKVYNDTFGIDFSKNKIPIYLTGSKDFETFQFEVNCPKQKVKLLAPMNSEEIKSTEDFKIKWDCGQDTNQSIRIIISNDKNKAITIYGKDQSEYILSKSYFDYFGKGKAKIEILVGNYKLIKTMNNRYIVGVVASSYESSFIIN